MSEGLKKRSLTIAGHPTSVSLEPDFWRALEEIAAARGLSLTALMAEIDRGRGGRLASAARLFVLAALRGEGRTLPSSAGGERAARS